MVPEGCLKPVKRVLELDLCCKLTVSGTPMYGAFEVLAAEQPVELQASRGAVVTDLCVEENAGRLEELETLEAKIGALVVARVSDAEMGVLEALHLREMAARHNPSHHRPKYLEFNQNIRLAAGRRNRSLSVIGR
jgi:DNA-binding GntR family transcriptional regulator